MLASVRLGADESTNVDQDDYQSFLSISFPTLKPFNLNLNTFNFGGGFQLLLLKVGKFRVDQLLRITQYYFSVQNVQ